MGTTGEYSDRTEWPVRSFLTEADAADLVVKATARAKDLDTTRASRYADVPKGANEYDPLMSMDYTGTTYYIMPVPLDDTVREAIAVTVQEDRMRAVSLGPLLPR